MNVLSIVVAILEGGNKTKLNEPTNDLRSQSSHGSQLRQCDIIRGCVPRKRGRRGGSLASGIAANLRSLESLETAHVHCQFLCGVYQGLDEHGIRIHSLRCSRGGLCFFSGSSSTKSGKEKCLPEGRKS